jgi:competence protein ComEC
MKGLWLFFAFASLAGCVLALPFHWGAFLYSGLLFLYLLYKCSPTIWIYCLLFTTTFFLYSKWHDSAQSTKLSGVESTFRIEIEDEYTIDGDRLSGIVKTENEERLWLTYTFSSKEEKEQFSPFVTCVVEGSLEKPMPPRNPNTFHFPNYLKQRHIYWTLQVSSFYTCEDSSGHFLKKWRWKGMEHIQSTFPENLVPIALALIFGERDQLSPYLEQAYQELGLIHLLAISGLHVGILTVSLFYTFVRIGWTKERTTYLLIGFLPIYAVLAGGSPSVLRAVIMTITILLSIRFNRRLSPLDGCSISFIISLLIEPHVLFHIGFQLSYGVTFILLLSIRLIQKVASSFWMSILFPSILAQTGVSPILLYHFYEISAISPLLNLIYVPYYTFIVLPIFLISFLLSFLFPTLIFFLLQQMEPLFVIMNEIVNACVEWDWHQIVTGRPSSVILMFLFFILIFTFYWMEKTERWWLSVVPLFILSLYSFIAPKWNPIGEIVFLDVGQGDCIVIRLPFQSGTYVIDTGGSFSFPKEEWRQQKDPFSIGTDIVLPFLKSRGITSIDKLILTHSDYDHIGEARVMIQELDVEEILISPGAAKKEAMAHAVNVAIAKGISVQEVQKGFRWSTKYGDFFVLSPMDSKYSGNNDSIVLYALVGGQTWLFTGDLEQEGEEALLKEWNFQVDVLKVGHHGSNTSSSEAFLRDIKPNVSIILVGKNNRYGHPHMSVLHRLQMYSNTVWRTDIHGAITYRFYLQGPGTFSVMIP